MLYNLVLILLFFFFYSRVSASAICATAQSVQTAWPLGIFSLTAWNVAGVNGARNPCSKLWLARPALAVGGQPNNLHIKTNKNATTTCNQRIALLEQGELTDKPAMLGKRIYTYNPRTSWFLRTSMPLSTNLVWLRVPPNSILNKTLLLLLPLR